MTAKDVEIYDPQKIGKCMAWSGDHTVYEYGEHEVIKFSKFDMLMGYALALTKSLHEIEICTSYFDDYFLPTRVVHAAKGDHVALVQKKIVGRPFMKKDMNNQVLRAQFSDFIEKYRQFLSEGNAPIDLYGGKGMYTPSLSNLFVTEGEQLVLIDATTLEITRFPLLARIICWPIFTASHLLQTDRIKDFERYAQNR